MRLRNQVKRRMRYFKRLRHAHYPGYIFGLNPSKATIPAFCFHDVTAERFAADLAYLRENGYRTLSTSEFIDSYGQPSNERRVLLTFDDARRNFWDVAFPLLQEFKSKATLFAPTYWIEGARQAPADGVPPQYSDTRFMTWEHLRVCSQSGLVDVQSHCHRHALVSVSGDLVDFASPQSLAHFDVYDWPMRWESGSDISGRPPLGTPIYEAAPLLSADQRVLPDSSAMQACQQFVAEHGDAGFFDRSDWRDQLMKVHREAIGQRPPAEACDPDAFQALIRAEFLRSREMFQAELGFTPRYLAFPWWLGSEKAIAAARESGIEVVFGVYVDFKKARNVAPPMRAFGRVNSDWLPFLPGKGRLQLYQPRVISKKVSDFLFSGYLAH